MDDFSRVTWLYLMKSRYEPFSHFSAFFVEMQTRFHVFVQTLRSDNVKEYLSEPFQSFLLQHGILHQTSCVDIPSHNGWFGKFSQAVEEFGMQKSKFDHSVFYTNSSSSIIMFVVYMDDIVITRSDSKRTSSL